MIRSVNGNETSILSFYDLPKLQPFLARKYHVILNDRREGHRPGGFGAGENPQGFEPVRLKPLGDPSWRLAPLSVT